MLCYCISLVCEADVVSVCWCSVTVELTICFCCTDVHCFCHGDLWSASVKQTYHAVCLYIHELVSVVKLIPTRSLCSDDYSGSHWVCLCLANYIV